ncbi:MAG: hypothetical protein K1X87_03540 [Dehalococcoidia bacterium]|nr:hypothetical protein [Dehalococcoidia bacterium]HRC62266.1 hypothetical protein [Dehalococcoidia bacterium]
MTSNRRTHYALRLDAEACGTTLGTLAWVMGALEILKDRGHATGDERWHELSDQLMPRLERVVQTIAGARMAVAAEAEQEAEVEDAYGRVRDAFERWIEVTAADTVEAALGFRHQLHDHDGEADAPAQ